MRRFTRVVALVPLVAAAFVTALVPLFHWMHLTTGCCDDTFGLAHHLGHSGHPTCCCCTGDRTVPGSCLAPATHDGPAPHDSPACPFCQVLSSLGSEVVPCGPLSLTVERRPLWDARHPDCAVADIAAIANAAPRAPPAC